VEINASQVALETGGERMVKSADRNTMTLCVVPCGRERSGYRSRGRATRAADVYIGPFAKKCQEYARMFYRAVVHPVGEVWFIGPGRSSRGRIM